LKKTKKKEKEFLKGKGGCRFENGGVVETAYRTKWQVGPTVNKEERRSTSSSSSNHAYEQTTTLHTSKN